MPGISRQKIAHRACSWAMQLQRIEEHSRFPYFGVVCSAACPWPAVSSNKQCTWKPFLSPTACWNIDLEASLSHRLRKLCQIKASLSHRLRKLCQIKLFVGIFPQQVGMLDTRHPSAATACEKTGLCSCSPCIGDLSSGRRSRLTWSGEHRFPCIV